MTSTQTADSKSKQMPGRCAGKWPARRVIQIFAASLFALAAFPEISLTAENPNTVAARRANVTHAPFGALPDGTPVERYTLRNSHGMVARIATYGGIVTDLIVPDRNGRHQDVVLGFDHLDDYLKGSPYFGALIGRYGNRIAGGRFTLDGVAYTLATNSPPNTLHGGARGFDKVVWQVQSARDGPHGPELTLNYVSRDGEEGYPGTLKVTAVYTVTDDDALRLDYTATTDRDTVVNLTQHSYFNLRGQGNGDILQHQVQINAERFTPVDSALIPIGKLAPVVGTPFDFRAATAIGARIGTSDEQLRFGHGYDHNWVINSAGMHGALALDATVFDPESGRVLEVLSDQPGLQFYTGNMLDGTLRGKGGRLYPQRAAFCVEPQHFPDSPNHPSFPSTVLKPGKIYRSHIEYRFSVRP